MPPITFKEFLLEAPETSEELEKIVSLIKRDCGPWLNEANGKFIYRGMRIQESGGMVKPVSDDLKDVFYIGTVRKDREPRDSPGWLHTFLNKKFQSKMGIPLRSQSLFVVGKPDHAENYGKVYAIFPIGNFEYAWSDKISDPTNDFYMFPMENGGIVDPNGTTSKYMERVEPLFFKYLKKNHKEIYRITGNDFNNFLMSDHEVEYDPGMIWMDFVKELLSNNELWLYNTGLQKALTPKFSEHELMIACNKYYALDVKQAFLNLGLNTNLLQLKKLLST